MTRTFPKAFLLIYGLGALGMAAIDVLAPERVAISTPWGFHPGWLRELACFDVFVAVLCANALRQHDLVRPTCLALAVLSVLLATNNLSGYLSGGPLGQLQPVVVHASAACAALLVVWALRPKHS